MPEWDWESEQPAFEQDPRIEELEDAYSARFLLGTDDSDKELQKIKKDCVLRLFDGHTPQVPEKLRPLLA